MIFFNKFVASELRDVESPEVQRWAKQHITTISCTAQSGVTGILGNLTLQRSPTF